jgi:hypothetical protein
VIAAAQGYDEEDPLTLKRISRVLLALIGWATPFACIAQADKSTKIHVVFKSYYERIRPGYAAGITTEEEPFPVEIKFKKLGRQVMEVALKNGIRCSILEKTLGMSPALTNFQRLRINNKVLEWKL